MVNMAVGPRRTFSRRVMLETMGMMAVALIACKGKGRKSAQDWYNEGQAHAKEKRWIPAFACFEKAVEIKPDFLEASLAQCDMLERSGSQGAAAMCFYDLSKARPELISIRLKAGVLFYKLGELHWDKALECFEAVLKKDPRNKEAIAFKCDIYLKRGVPAGQFMKECLAAWKETGK